MAPILARGLPACGICRNFPRDITYAPSKFQGIGLKNPFITMGLARLATLVQEGQTQSITGQLIRASIEATKLELGLGSALFQADFKCFGRLVMDCWISHSWKVFQEFDIELIEGTPGLPLRRRGDLYLIQAFVSNHFKGQELICLNRCHLFLRVITGADGKTITLDAWYG
jgi:hypothetical protein